MTVGAGFVGPAAEPSFERRRDRAGPVGHVQLLIYMNEMGFNRGLANGKGLVDPAVSVRKAAALVAVSSGDGRASAR